jgi:peptidoglycan/xylan/chitin deacetylase (PgdA/CDA1 family)
MVQKRIKLPVQQAPKRTSAGENDLGGGVPILMYHRVAIDGPSELTRFRVDPTLFDEQINALKQAGFRPIVLNDYVEAVSRSQALPGKPIVVTFDDGYRDFLTGALPALRKYSFAATVFVVAGRIGGVAEWDLRYGKAAALMSWEELSAIASEGVELGCHSLFHQPMTEMKHADLLTEIGQAREVLELGLGNAVLHFAYPYGAENIFVRNLVAVLGFRSAVTCRAGISRLGNDVMRLPRIEVHGNCTPEELLIQLGSS